MYKCDLIYVYREKHCIFLPIFTKLANAEQHYLQISYISPLIFIQNSTRNVENIEKNSFPPLRKKYGFH